MNPSQPVRHIVLRGLGRGLLASFLGSLIFSLLEFTFLILENIRMNPSVVKSTDFESLFLGVFFLAVGFFLSFLFSAVPGSLGGAVIGLILYILNTRNTLSKGMAVLVGLLVGCLSGYLSLQLANLKVDIVLEMTDLVILATVIATLAGGWVGKQMGDYVQRNVK